MRDRTRGCLQKGSSETEHAARSSPIGNFPCQDEGFSLKELTTLSNSGAKASKSLAGAEKSTLIIFFLVMTNRCQARAVRDLPGLFPCTKSLSAFDLESTDLFEFLVLIRSLSERLERRVPRRCKKISDHEANLAGIFFPLEDSGLIHSLRREALWDFHVEEPVSLLDCGWFLFFRGHGFSLTDAEGQDSESLLSRQSSLSSGQCISRYFLRNRSNQA